MLFLLRIFKLLTYCHTLPGSYQFGQIGVERMMRKSSQLYGSGFAVHPPCQCDTQYLRRLHRILTHALVEIAHTEKKNSIGVTLLHIGVLPHYRSLRYFLGLGGLYRLGGFRRKLLYPLRIIQLIIKTQFQ